MTISLRSVKMLMHDVVPGIKISEDAVRVLKVYLERKGEELTIHASRIREKENEMRDQLGERHKKILSTRHLTMAIDGKFSKKQEDESVNSQH